MWNRWITKNYIPYVKQILENLSHAFRDYFKSRSVTAHLLLEETSLAYLAITPHLYLGAGGPPPNTPTIAFISIYIAHAMYAGGPPALPVTTLSITNSLIFELAFK